MKQEIQCATSETIIHATRQAVWNKVGFYEHVKKTPGLLLKLSLPVPREVHGQHEAVGDICRCLYSDGGFLTKKITRIVNDRRIEFEIIEQSIRYQHSVKLLGGYIEVVSLNGAQSSVRMGTYYSNRIAPRALSQWMIESVIKRMHRFVMQDMRDQLESSAATTIACDAVSHG